MKYIRTKDGIYNAIKEFKIGEMIGVPYNGLVKIIAQADTIEELCDEFVYISKSKNNKGKHHLNIALPNYLCKSFKTKEMYMNKFEIYGAIWTDKGLIYVAKMNKKGELELL